MNNAVLQNILNNHIWIVCNNREELINKNHVVNISKSGNILTIFTTDKSSVTLTNWEYNVEFNKITCEMIDY